MLKVLLWVAFHWPVLSRNDARPFVTGLDHFNDYFIYVSIASARLNTLKCI